MSQTSYKISEARKKFAEVLERANQGEEIVIMRGKEVYARIGPGTESGKRPFGLLRDRRLPDDLFDTTDAEQAAIDAGDWNDDDGIWRGKSVVPESPKSKSCSTATPSIGGRSAVIACLSRHAR